jgi:predicted O-methyltransferase YrrM
MSQALISKMYDQYGSEVVELSSTLETKINELRTRGVELYPDIRIASDGKTAGTISTDDFAILHLLIRTFKPQAVFEVGTWLGTSAMVMADAMHMNGSGHIYTCDQNSYYALDESYDEQITRLIGFSDVVVNQLPTDCKVDMIFADGELTFNTLKALAPHMSDNTIIVTHDYEGIAEKGVTNLIRSQVVEYGKYEMIINPQINTNDTKTTIAILIPPAIISSLKLHTTNYLFKYIYLLYLAIKTYSFLILRKIGRVIKSTWTRTT